MLVPGSEGRGADTRHRDRAESPRWIDAAAALAPADRALLNLWVEHGLPDATVAQMTGMDAEAVARRRQRIAERLGPELGMAPAEICAALAGPAAHGAPVNANGNGHGSPPAPGAALGTADTAGAADAAGTADAADAVQQRRRRRLRLWLSGAMVFMVVIVVALVIALTGGSGRRPHRQAATPHPAPAVAAPAVTPPTLTTAAPPAATPPPAAPRPAVSARALAHAHGSVLLRVKDKHLKLKLTVRDLPSAHDGHYEVWLYNSPRHARALARLRNGKHHLTVKLPRHAARYRWIEISFQPLGAGHHPVQPVLRSRNPARATRKQLRKRSARRRQLRRLASGSSSASKSK